MYSRLCQTLIVASSCIAPTQIFTHSVKKNQRWMPNCCWSQAIGMKVHYYYDYVFYRTTWLHFIQITNRTWLTEDKLKLLRTDHKWKSLSVPIHNNTALYSLGWNLQSWIIGFQTLYQLPYKCNEPSGWSMIAHLCLTQSHQIYKQHAKMGWLEQSPYLY